MLNPLWLLFSIVVWLKKTTSLPKLYFIKIVCNLLAECGVIVCDVIDFVHLRKFKWTPLQYSTLFHFFMKIKETRDAKRPLFNLFKYVFYF